MEILIKKDNEVLKVKSNQVVVAYDLEESMMIEGETNVLFLAKVTASLIKKLSKELNKPLIETGAALTAIAADFNEAKEIIKYGGDKN